LTAIISYVLITTATNNNGCHNQEAQLCPDYADQFGVMFLLGKFGAPEKFFASALTGIFLTGLAAHSITKTNIKPVMRFIEWIGQKSLDLFILNGFFLLFIEKKFIQQHFKVGTSLLETTVCGHHYLLYSIFPPENHSTNNQQPAACLQCFQREFLDAAPSAIHIPAKLQPDFSGISPLAPAQTCRSISAEDFILLNA